MGISSHWLKAIGLLSSQLFAHTLFIYQIIVVSSLVFFSQIENEEHPFEVLIHDYSILNHTTLNLLLTWKN